MFDALPPEVNSALMYTGPGAGPLLEASQAWATLATELYSTGAALTHVTTALMGSWTGPSSWAATQTLTTFATWITAIGEQCAHTAQLAAAAASAYSAAFAATVPPALIAANRAQLATLVATNFLGVNTAAIAANEAAYMQMWAQDAATMHTYMAQASAITASLPQFTPPGHTPGLLTPHVPTGQPAGAQNIINTILQWLQNTFNPNGVPLFGLDSGSLLGQYIQQSLSGGYPAIIAQIFSNLIAYSALGGAVVADEHARTALLLNPPQAGSAVATGGAPDIKGSGAPPVSARVGGAPRAGRLSVPPAWGNPPPGERPQVAPARPDDTGRYPLPIPVPFHVTPPGGRAPRRERPDPQYGKTPIVMPKHPYGG